MTQCNRCQKSISPGAERCPHCGAWIDQTGEPAPPNHGSLEDSVRALLGQGQKIEAIRLYREQTGLGLTAAKTAVERIGRGESAPAGGRGTAGEAVTDELDQQILDLLTRGQKIAAIKLYREKTSVGLKEAKDAVEALGARHGIAPAAPSGCLGVVALVAVGVALDYFVW